MLYRPPGPRIRNIFLIQFTEFYPLIYWMRWQLYNIKKKQFAICNDRWQLLQVRRTFAVAPNDHGLSNFQCQLRIFGFIKDHLLNPEGPGIFLRIVLSSNYQNADIGSQGLISTEAGNYLPLHLSPSLLRVPISTYIPFTEDVTSGLRLPLSALYQLFHSEAGFSLNTGPDLSVSRPL